MPNDIEMFNTHQEDIRRRVDSIARALFVLSGGALTVSIGLFTNPASPSLNPWLLGTLKVGWAAFFASIVVLAVALVVIIARDYAFGERWRKKVNGVAVDVSGSPGWVDVLIWLFGLGGLLAFVIGMLSLAYVSIGLLDSEANKRLQPTADAAAEASR